MKKYLTVVDSAFFVAFCIIISATFLSEEMIPEGWYYTDLLWRCTLILVCFLEAIRALGRIVSRMFGYDE